MLTGWQDSEIGLFRWSEVFTINAFISSILQGNLQILRRLKNVFKERKKQEEERKTKKDTDFSGLSEYI